jgi:tripartite-type tricarboxylate transporter receptor subunit TctC
LAATRRRARPSAPHPLRNTPLEIVDKLHGEINAALADPNIVARLTEAGVTILILSRTGFGKFIAQETEK